MSSQEPTFVTRKAEDRLPEPERTGAYAHLYTHKGKTTGKRELNGKLFHLLTSQW